MYFVVYTSRALLKFDGDFAPDLGTEDIPADIVSEKDFLVSDCHRSRPSHLLSLYVLYVRFDKWEIILQHNVRRGIILGQHFESGFRRFVSKKKYFFHFFIIHVPGTTILYVVLHNKHTIFSLFNNTFNVNIVHVHFFIQHVPNDLCVYKNMSSRRCNSF